MITVPVATPVTPPVADTEALAALPLLQVPPVPVVVNRLVLPIQTDGLPLMVPGLGNGLTVTSWVSAMVPQLLVTVYDTMVVPAVIPLTVPEVFTEATDGLVELQVPPVPVVVRVMELPAQTVLAPVTLPEAAAGLMVML